MGNFQFCLEILKMRKTQWYLETNKSGYNKCELILLVFDEVHDFICFECGVFGSPFMDFSVFNFIHVIFLIRKFLLLGKFRWKYKFFQIIDSGQVIKWIVHLWA